MGEDMLASHEDEDLASVERYKLLLPNDQISYRAVERGLCSVCSQYDWRWHMTPNYIIPPGCVYRSRSDYEQRSFVTGEKFHHDVDDDRIRRDVLTTRAPYPGHYTVTSIGSSPINAYIQLSPFSTMLRTRVYCTLCDLAVRAIGSMLHGKELEELQKSLEPMKLSCHYLGRRRTAITFYHIGDTSHEVPRLSLDLLSEVTQPPPKDGRITRSDQADLKVLKRFWATCQQDHPECACKPTQFEACSSTTSTDRQLRVIDVRQARIINAPSGCRYVALSYVWGAGKKTSTVTSDFIDPSPNLDSSLSSAAYAVLDQDSLSPAFKDAMCFTESTGERYLWIDQLCILQDNVEHKTYSISVMDQIYKGAIYTIIAADSNVHSTGLSGVRPKSRNYDPVIGTIDNVMLIQAEPEIDLDSYDSPLGTSAWNTRGWTLQEFILSSRIFVFVRDRVYYQCARGVVGEAEPGRILSHFHTIPGGEIYDREPFAHYGALVLRYTTRILTYPNDILNAFAGLMSDLNHKFDFQFCHGLPTKYIYLGLMWRTVTGNNNEMARRDGFPSWSWAGWFNAVEYDMNLASESINVHIEWRGPEVDWNTVQRTGALEFRTHSVVLDPQDYPEPDFIDGYDEGMGSDMLDIRKVWREGPRECFKLAQMHYHDDTPEDETTEALLIVKEISPGIYEREGFAEVFTPFVNRFESTVKDIILV